MSMPRRPPAPLAWFACYGAWIAISIGAGLVAAQILPLSLDISLALGANPWVGRAVRQLSLPVIGIIWLVAIFWSEHALRQALTHGRFRASLLRIGGALGAAAAGLLLVRALIPG